MSHKVLFRLLYLIFDIALIWMLFGRMGKRGTVKVRDDGRAEFSPDWIGLSAYPLIIAYSTWLAIGDLIRHHEALFDFLNPLVFASVALSLFFTFPGTLVSGPGGLEEVYWFRKNKQIRWEDVEEIETDEGNVSFSTVTVRSAHGVRIVHSGLLADRKGFLQEIEKHCGENLPPEFPRQDRR